MPATLRWLGLALLGILVAGGVAIAASRLASQQIGLASEPISAGDALAPTRLSSPRRRQRPPRHQAKLEKTVPTVPTATAPPPTTTPAPAPPGSESHSTGGGGEHHGGGGEHHGGGGGGHADD